MNVERFKQLWQETINIVSYEFRLQSNKGLVNVKQITDFYQRNVIDDLWFTNSMACDYNQWIALNIDTEADKKRIHLLMRDINIGYVSSVLPFVIFGMGVLSLLLGIILCFFDLIPVSIVLISCSLVISVVGFIVFKKNRGLTDYETVEKELTRVGNTIEQFLDCCEKIN